MVMRERRGGSRKTPGFGCGGVGVEEGMLNWGAEVLGKNNGKGADIGSILGPHYVSAFKCCVILAGYLKAIKR